MVIIIIEIYFKTFLEIVIMIIITFFEHSNMYFKVRPSGDNLYSNLGCQIYPLLCRPQNKVFGATSAELKVEWETHMFIRQGWQYW